MAGTINISIDKIDKSNDIPNSVVEQIVKLISGGILKPGDRLPSELEMTRRFGISRISLREAMKLLEAKGYIDSRGRKGKYIRSVFDDPLSSPIDMMLTNSPVMLDELLKARKIIDTGSTIAAASAGEGNREILTEYKKILKKKCENPDHGNNFNINDVILLYEKISEVSQNTIHDHLIKSLNNTLRNVLGPAWNIPVDRPNCLQNIFIQQIKIIDAIESGNCDLARKTVHENIDSIREVFSSQPLPAVGE